MSGLIIVLIIFIMYYLFQYAYKENIKLQNAKLIKNMKEYDKKKKTKQQKS